MAVLIRETSSFQDVPDCTSPSVVTGLIMIAEPIRNCVSTSNVAMSPGNSKKSGRITVAAGEEDVTTGLWAL